MNEQHKHIRSLSSQRGALGFTLIELMIAILVVSILAAIAVPSYINQVRKSRRTEAKTALLDLAGREERYFNTNNVYSNVAANLGYAAAGATTVITSLTVGSGYYQVTIPAPTAGTTTAPATYSITAVPVPGNDQAKDTSCASFMVTSAGAQTSQNSAGTDTTSTCWR
jgi:type IV pilus assembly protein PilE